jgi:hypothetical protein
MSHDAQSAEKREEASTTFLFFTVPNRMVLPAMALPLGFFNNL